MGETRPKYQLVRRLLIFMAGFTVVGLGVAGYFKFAATPDETPLVSLPPAPSEASEEQVRVFCGACHATPPPDIFPRSAWRKQVKQGYDFFRDSNLPLDQPSIESVARYYENRAPMELPALDRGLTSDRLPVQFERIGVRLPGPRPHPSVTNVNLVHLSDPRKLDVLVCDARRNEVLVWKPYNPAAGWRTLGKVEAPAHAEVVDLDGDGIPDLIVASLGEFYPTDAPVGGVVWLRGQSDGSFTAIPLLQGVGRVADVQAADFRGTGRLDLVVAVFGWQNTGEVLLLENHTTDWSNPTFVPRVLDPRHGTIHVPVVDLNKDGRPDFVALISQEHETIVAFLNEGGGDFRKETIYTAPHPAYGSSGIQLVDLNGDGNLDVLYTNGDVMDPPPILKPYHGVQWLENKSRFPFTHHPIAAMYGVERAVTTNVKANGLLDIVAVSYLPEEMFPQRRKMELESVVLLEQTAPGRFVRHTLETATCDHFTCAAGDLFGDGRTHVVTGSFQYTTHGDAGDAITIWKNLGPKP
jgi:hypothetical protein